MNDKFKIIQEVLWMVMVLSLIEPASASASTNFVTTGSLSVGRYGATATLLQNGKVLVVAGATGNSYFSSAELYDVTTGIWSPTGGLTNSRSLHAATQLPDGRVLVTGGINGSTISGVELYDPDTGTWSVTNSLITARSGHTATLLSNGKVLIAGGGSLLSTVSSCELFDPANGTWMATSPMIGRYKHTATLLPNGTVLVAGGANSNSVAEVYDSNTGLWSDTGAPGANRKYHTATLLANGKVLVAGGLNGGTSAELYDPATGTWEDTGIMNAARINHAAALLPNGKVLVAGGSIGNTMLSSAEVYDPDDGTWTMIGPLSMARTVPTATVLPNGKVLVAAGGGLRAAGFTNAELYEASPAGFNRLSVQKMESGEVEVSFVGMAGWNYALEKNSNLSLTNWLPVVTNTAGTNGLIHFTNPLISNSNQYWRVRYVP